MTQPLLGILPSLDSLFEGFQFQIDAPLDYVLLSGLPGTVRTGSFLFAKPVRNVREAIEARCTNRVIGGFRAIRSAQWMKHGLLPVYAWISRTSRAFSRHSFRMANMTGSKLRAGVRYEKAPFQLPHR